MKRPRRLRATAALRSLVSETQLSLDSMIQPYFVSETPKAKEPISGFTEVFRWGVDALSKQIEKDLDRSLNRFLLFGGTQQKDATGSESRNPSGLLPTTIQTLKARFGSSLVLFSDVCLCPFTSHGHCGYLDGNRIDNDPSLQALSEMALCHAQAGVDFVAPSDMMDGRIGAIRTHLDESGQTETGILAYTAKYASSYYGPFRNALDSNPKGDRKTYQMDPRNQKEALRELTLDIEEGADMVMVKPALAYLDILSLFAKNSPVPVAAYSVSAEYEMVKLLAREGLADEKALAQENLTAIRRAGAQILITYFATHIAEKGWLR